MAVETHTHGQHNTTVVTADAQRVSTPCQRVVDGLPPNPGHFSVAQLGLRSAVVYA